MMKKEIIALFVVLILVLPLTAALAKHHTAEERGRAHFNNPSFAGGKTSCSTCHPNGRGLENAGTKEGFSIGSNKQASLEDMINVCIVNANKGNALALDATEMQELSAYVRSLVAAPPSATGK